MRDWSSDVCSSDLKENKDFPDVYRELGLLLLKENKNNEAKEKLKKYVDLAPNAKDVEIVKSYIK